MSSAAARSSTWSTARRKTSPAPIATVRAELKAYGGNLVRKKELVALNKIDAMTAEDIEAKRAAAGQGQPQVGARHLRRLRPGRAAVAARIAEAGREVVLGCSGRDPVADDANDTAGLPAGNVEIAARDGAPPQNATVPVGRPPAPSAAIPAALQGRWGLTPGDCTSTLGDAKGLLIVNSTELRFYK